MDLLDDISEDENIQEDENLQEDSLGTLGQGHSPGDDLDKSKGPGPGQGPGQDPGPSQDQLDSALRQVIDTFKHRFPGVEEVLHGEQYVRWIAQQVDFHWDSPGESQSQSQESFVISPEQQLIVSTLSHRFPQGLEAPSGQELAPLQRFLHLSSALKTIHAQLTASIHLQAPNVCALVGPEIAARLVAHYGSVRELSCVPSCNLVTFGRNRQGPSQGQGNALGIGKGNGLIYSCDIVQQQHPEFRKQAARMVCAKLVIAARIDANGPGHGPGPAPANADALSGAAGTQLRTQILERLQKVSTPPQLSRVKPLPVPEDKPKKKRAGKRFRKYKQQFQLSHMRQLQNRMEFGRAEHTTMDAYGEEIGMGLARVSGPELSLGPSPGPSPGPRPKMSKAMRKRLESGNTGPVNGSGPESLGPL